MRCLLLFALALMAQSYSAHAITVTVDNTNDTGPGSLRDAITQANSNNLVEQILIDLTGPDNVIQPLSPLPVITPAAFFGIDILTPSTFTGGPRQPAILDGQLAGDTHGLVIQGTVNVYTLDIIRFERSGIVVEGVAADNMEIADCFIGTDGTECLGNLHHGILVRDGANAIYIGNQINNDAGINVISGNGFDGIRVLGPDTTQVFITSTFVGTDASSTLPIGNGWRSFGLNGVWVAPKPESPEEGFFEPSGIQPVDNIERGGGVLIAEGATSVFLSARPFVDDELNEPFTPVVVSGNHWYGVKIHGEDTDGVRIKRCRIGTDVTGLVAVPNEEEGIHIAEGPDDTVIGGFASSGPGFDNVIGANNIGVRLQGPDIENTRLEDNYLGASLDGGDVVPIPNRGVGVLIEQGASGSAFVENTIRYNRVHGIQMEGASTLGNQLFANNSIADHPGKGVQLIDGANAGIEPPVITDARSNFGIGGTVGEGYDVTAYAGDDDEGLMAVGVGSEFAGSFSITFFVGVEINSLVGKSVTAIATDPDGNSSEFSAPVIFEDVFATEGEGDGGGEGTGVPMLEVDFIGDLEFLKSNPLLGYMPEPFRSYLIGLDLQNADLNGGIELNVSTLNGPGQGMVEDSVQELPNGISDAQEYALLEFLIENPDFDNGVVTGRGMAEAYLHNRETIVMEQFGATFGPVIDANLPRLVNVFAAYSMTGDGGVNKSDGNTLSATGQFGKLKGYFQFFGQALEGFNRGKFTSLELDVDDFMTEPNLLPTGDIDGDGTTNLVEWETYGPTDFVNGALDPDMNPNAPTENCGSAPVYGESFVVTGSNIGAIDNYNLSTESSACAGGGPQFPETGIGPDEVFAFQAGEGCETLTLSLQPEESADLALIVVTDCGDIDGSCVFVDDGGAEGVSEDLVIDVAVGTTYYIIVDSYDGMAGGYTLTGVADGCEPVSEGENCILLFHSADQDGDNSIELGELLRVIQFHNVDGFSCDDPKTPSEDGYMPGPGAQDCCPHTGDYVGGEDWTIELTELLRMIQIFNTFGYTNCPGDGTEDGFCPNPA